MDWWGDFVGEATGLEVAGALAGVVSALGVIAGGIVFIVKFRSVIAEKLAPLRKVPGRVGAWLLRLVPVRRSLYSNLVDDYVNRGEKLDQLNEDQQNAKSEIESLGDTINGLKFELHEEQAKRLRAQTQQRAAMKKVSELTEELTEYKSAADVIALEMLPSERLDEESRAISALFDDKGKYLGATTVASPWRAYDSGTVLTLRNDSDETIKQVRAAVFNTRGTEDSSIEVSVFRPRSEMPLRATIGSRRARRVRVEWVGEFNIEHAVLIPVRVK